MSDIECPYCGYEQDICHDDGFGYEEGVKHQMECIDCHKTFVFETAISFNYEAQKADCLNGDSHNWNPTKTYPREFTKMRCSICGEERELTAGEWKLLNNDKL